MTLSSWAEQLLRQIGDVAAGTTEARGNSRRTGEKSHQCETPSCRFRDDLSTGARRMMARLGVKKGSDTIGQVMKRVKR